MTEAFNSISQNVDRYATYFSEYDRLKTQDAPVWLHQLRKNAISRFTELGIPVTRDLSFPLKEDWLYTNLAPLAKTPFGTDLRGDEYLLDSEVLLPYGFGQDDWQVLVFVNGNYSPARSHISDLPQGIIVQPISRALIENPELVEPHLAKYADYDQIGLTALNTALLRDGLFVYVPDGKILETPIHVQYVSTACEASTAAHPRTLIVAGDAGQATVIESYIGLTDETYLTNAVTEIAVGRDGNIDHYRINREGSRACHISTTQLHLKDNSHISTFNMSMGGKLTRNDSNARLDGEHAVVRMNGLFLVAGDQHVDNHTSMDHAQPNCDSYEVYKGILDGNSRGVFNGKVYVKQDAQETDAKQLNKNLLLSPNALIHTKPQLEIYADQVKCTHGATIGQLDEDQIFYLRSRGLSRDIACHLLTYGFAADLIRRLKVEAVREQLDTLFETTIQQLSLAQSRDD
jgi:Fe-S cluster assembly protein SufD